MDVKNRQDRFQAACAALTGFCANPSVYAPNGMRGWGLVNCDIPQLTDFCWQHADDLLLAERNNYMDKLDKTAFNPKYIETLTEINKHTPEPWEHGKSNEVVSDSPVYNGDDSNKYYGKYLVCESITEANASRVIACVNAFAGVDNPETMLNKLRADREILIDALKMYLQYEGCLSSQYAREALDRVQAV